MEGVLMSDSTGEMLRDIFESLAAGKMSVDEVLSAVEDVVDSPLTSFEHKTLFDSMVRELADRL